MMNHNALRRPTLLVSAMAGAALWAGSAFAADISLTPPSAQILQTDPVGVQFLVHWEGDGQRTSFSGGINFDNTRFTVTRQIIPDPDGVVSVTCQVNQAAGIVAIVLNNGDAQPINTADYCRLTFTTNAAALGMTNITWSGESFAGGVAASDTATGATLEVIDTPPEPPTITLDPNGGTVSLAQGGGAVGAAATNGTITVTAAGGVGGGTGSYNCAVPAGFTVSNNANAAFGNGSVDMSVGCTMGAAANSASMTCAVTDAGGDRNVNYTLECPAGASAIYSSAPPAGNALATCSGAPGSTTTTTLSISNIGTPANPESASDDLAVACSITGGAANFAITGAPANPLEAGASTDVTVECTIPDSGEVAGELTCNGNAYPLSALVQTLPPAIPQPNVIPTNSFWSKMVLFGLLAGLGMLVVSLRRNG